LQDDLKPAVIAISSHVARGAVGNRSIVHVFETFGHSVWAVPTVMLPFHPGHGRSTRIEPDPARFSGYLDDLAGSKWLGEVGAIITGYMASAEQVLQVARFVRRVKERIPTIPYLCDPVIGDAGGLYVAREIASAIRDELLPLATMATPNRYELAWLSARATIETAAEAEAAARELGTETVIVTTAPVLMRGNVANLLVDAKGTAIAEHRIVDGPRNGAGDLLAALFLARRIGGLAPVEALEKASASVLEIVAHAARMGNDELMPQAVSHSILSPMTMVSVRSIATAARRK
jgi:pyridoxine kinase